MNVSLPPERESFVQGMVSTGRYTSASEVVREALRLLEEHEKVRASQLGEFRAEADRRLASLDRGEGIDGEMVFARIREKSDRRVDGQVGSGRYSGVREYMRDDVRDGEKRKAQKKLEALLEEGIQSGEATEMTRPDWSDIRAEALEQFEARKARKSA